MYKVKKLFIGIVMALACVSVSFAEPLQVGVVDIVRLSKDSKTGRAVGTHLDQVQKILQDGMNKVTEAYKGLNNDFTRKTIADAARTLNRQNEIERGAAFQIFDREVDFAVNEWIKTSKCPLVVSRQNVLAAAEANDITSEIIKIMDTRADLVKLPALPKVTINPPPIPKQESKQAPKAAPKPAVTASQEMKKKAEPVKQKAPAPVAPAKKDASKSKKPEVAKTKNTKKK